MLRFKAYIHSFAFRIWMLIMAVLIFFMICVSLINTVVLHRSKENFIYRQLYEVSETKKNLDKREFGKDDLALSTTFINHFLLMPTEDGYRIKADDTTSRIYLEKDNNNVLEHIKEHVVAKIQDGHKLKTGKLVKNERIYYFYVDEWDTEGAMMIFLTSTSKEDQELTGYWISLMLVAILSFFAVHFISRKMVAPIKNLQDFSNHVAHHQWHCVPISSNITEISQLSDSLIQMRDILKETDERERQFLQASSHNLKTPVMIIKGYAQALKDGIKLGNDSNPVDIISKEAENLERRISQMLKLNVYGHSLEVTKMSDVIRLDRLIRSLVHRFQAVRPDLAWDISLQEFEMHCNSDALLTAFENLIENQMRYATSTIRIHLQTSSEHAYELFFENDGPCFDVTDPNSLFNRYKKDKAGQWGLGLAIVKQVIEGHDGTITAENLPNSAGVRFNIKGGH